MKDNLTIRLFGIFALNGASQLNTRHLFGNITPQDVMTASSLKNVSASNFNIKLFPKGNNY